MNIKATVNTIANNAKIFGKKNAPVLMFGAGLAGLIWATAEAVKATLKADEKIIEPARKEFEAIEIERDKALTEGFRYDEKVYKTRRREVRLRSFGRAVKLYGKAAAIWCAAITLTVGGMKLQTTRLTTAVGLANAATTALNEYRERTRTYLGDDIDRALYTGRGLQSLTDNISPNTADVKSLPVDNLKPVGAFTVEYERSKIQLDYRDQFYDIVSMPIEAIEYLRSMENRFNRIVDEKGYIELNEMLDRLHLIKRHEFDDWVICPPKGCRVHAVDLGLGYLYQILEENRHLKHSDLCHVLRSCKMADGQECLRKVIIDFDPTYIKHISDVTYC